MTWRTGLSPAAAGVPVGGAAGQQLAKISDRDYDTGWADPAAGDVMGPASAVDSRLVFFDGTSGKLLKDMGFTIDTDGTLTTNSDTRLATQKAVKTYADSLIAAQDAMVFKGVIDCSGNPNYPAADRGHTYRVSVAGKIGGAAGVNVEAGDILLCLTDATPAGNHATVGANWAVIQANVDGAVIGPASAVDSRLAAFDGVTGKLLKDSGLVLSAAAIAFLADPTSANLRALLTDESGTGAALFADGNIGAATGTSLALTGNMTTSGGAFGNATGNGGTVTQTGSKAGAVTLNKRSGLITMVNSAIAAGGAAVFSFNNSTIVSGDMVDIKHWSTGTIGAYTFNASTTAGVASVTVRNVSAGSLSEAIVLHFVIIRAPAT